MNTYTRRFVTEWAKEHARPVVLSARHEEASRLARKLLEAGAREGLARDDIEEAIDAELEFYMFQAVTGAMTAWDANRRSRATPATNG